MASPTRSSNDPTVSSISPTATTLARLPKPRLLGPFDPLLLGWVSRDSFVGTHQGVVTNNGLFRACALVTGRVGRDVEV